jgi:hypothetical protein
MMVPFSYSPSSTAKIDDDLTEVNFVDCKSAAKHKAVSKSPRVANVRSFLILFSPNPNPSQLYY